MSQKKILIVDDSQVVLKALSSRLQAEGYATLSAEDGSEALRLFRNEKPDLVLMDINFPPDVGFGGNVSWDGFRIIEWMRKSGLLGATPSIIITSEDPAKYRAQAMEAGAVEVFQKPISVPYLLKTIRGCLDAVPAGS